MSLSKEQQIVFWVTIILVMFFFGMKSTQISKGEYEIGFYGKKIMAYIEPPPQREEEIDGKRTLLIEVRPNIEGQGKRASEQGLGLQMASRYKYLLIVATFLTSLALFVSARTQP